MRKSEKGVVRAVSGSGGREVCLGASSCLGGVGSAGRSSGMLERVPLGSSDFWRLVATGADRLEVACCSSSLSDALRMELSPFNVQVVVVAPGK